MTSQNSHSSPPMSDSSPFSHLFRDLNERELAKVDAILKGDFMPIERFVDRAWKVIDPGVPLMWNWHMLKILQHLEACTLLWMRNIIFNIPPRCTKSRLVSVMWPAWVWTWLPHTRWLFSSYAGERAVQDSVDTRRILQSPWYQENWGHVFQLTGDQNVKSRYQNDQGGLRVSTGVRGKGLGEGGDFIVTDDPHKREEVFSDKVRKGTNEWWTRTMGTRDNNPNTSVRAIILQRLHEEDIVGHVTENEAQPGGRRYVKLVFPMEWEGNDVPTPLGPKQDPRTKLGELLHAERFTPAAVQALKVSLGTYGYGSQCQQNPGALVGNIFLKTNWRFWQREGDNYPQVQYRDAENEIVTCGLETLPTTFSQLAQTWDMNFKETEHGSHVSGQVWGRKGANRYLLDVERGRVDIIQVIRWMLSMTSRWPKARLKLVEDKANGPAIITMLGQKVGGIVSYSPHGSKTARAIAFKPDHEAGNYFLPHPRIAPWVKAMIDRFAQFPAGSDDEIDAFSQLMDHFTEDEQQDADIQSQAVSRDAVMAMLG